ncbi:hypothetical protein ACWCPQ_14555 [Nocardia sp. NPDC001965]
MSTSIARLPRVPESVAPLPKIPETRALLPRVNETQLPKGLIPFFPPRLEVESSSVGTSSVDVAGTMLLTTESTATGSSALDLLPIALLTTESTSSGASSADVFDDKGIEVVSSSEGSSLVEVSGLLIPESASSGTSGVLFGFDTVSSGSGDSTALVSLIGILIPESTASGTSSVDLRTFTPSGMNKSGSFSLANGTTEQVVTGWAADTAGYPGSSLSGNGLVVQTSTTTGTVAISVVAANTNTFSTVNLTLRVQKNGSAWQAFDVLVLPANSSATYDRSLSGLTLAAGDVLTLTAQIGASATAFRRIDSGWLRITQP